MACGNFFAADFADERGGVKLAEIDNDWTAFEGGATVGQPGGERGVVIRDDELVYTSRITLERSSEIAPFAITCGLYGWFVHTRFFSTEAEAQDAFREMKLDLGRIAGLIPDEANFDRLRPTVQAAIHKFIERFP
jgi:hypothetical protein